MFLKAKSSAAAGDHHPIKLSTRIAATTVGGSDDGLDNILPLPAV
jgi:hypothetical protein